MEFYSKAIFNGNSEERKILQETFQETVAELNTKTSNATQKEMEWAAGYVSAEVLITLALSKGITKVADSVADAGKVGSVVLNNADDLSKASLQAASKSVIGSADEVLDAGKYVDDVVDYQKMAANVAAQVGDKLKPQELLDELAKSGQKVSMDKVVAVTKDANGKLIWLEQGNKSTAGLWHILQRHSVDFLDKGISMDDIPEFIMKIFREGTVVEELPKGEKIYKLIVNGKEELFRGVVSGNGFIVTVFPNNH